MNHVSRSSLTKANKPDLSIRPLFVCTAIKVTNPFIHLLFTLAIIERSYFIQLGYKSRNLKRDVFF